MAGQHQRALICKTVGSWRGISASGGTINSAYSKRNIIKTIAMAAKIWRKKN